MSPSLHSSIFVLSMISFWSAAGIHQLTMYPDPLFSLAAMTKHASCGPRLVTNMPAPHGHQVGFSFLGLPQGWHKQPIQPGQPYFMASMRSRLFTACNACSSPGYEILGIGGITQLGGLPMQP